MAAWQAASALVRRRQLSALTFAAHYAPFASVIPPAQAVELPPIVDRFVYENPHPDWVVLVEETIIKAVNFLRGTPERGGVVVVNSVRDPHYLLKFLGCLVAALL